MKTIKVEELKIRIYDSLNKKDFDCFDLQYLYRNIDCDNCIFCEDNGKCNSSNYNFSAIKSHDFGTKTEVSIEDLEMFKIK